MNKQIENLFFCPSSKEKLKLEDGELFSQSTSYPLFSGIPWLFKDPEYHFLEWGTKIESFIKEESTYIQHLQSMINLNKNKLTRQRLSKIHEAKSKNLKTISKTLEEFLGHEQIPIASSTQQIHSYFQLIFRDWCWETEENKTYLNYVNDHIPKEAKNILVLGCGAAGLSYDIAKENQNLNVISLDHNPFLLLTAQKIFQGEEVKLSDYTNYPKSIDLTSKTYKIKKDKLNLDNHQFVLGSFPDLPFKEESFDMIIAPWFFDILNFNIFDSIKFSSSFLKPDGNICFFGPNNVHHQFLAEQYTSEEILEELKVDFKDVSRQVKTLQYLNNPLNSQNRIEDIMFFNLFRQRLKGKQIKIEHPKKSNTLKYEPSFEHYKAVNETFYHILKHIDSDIDVQELGKKLEKEFSFNPEEALYYAQNFINKVLEEISKIKGSK